MPQPEDITHGIPAHWDNRAIQIIEELLKKNGDQYTYAEIADALQTSGTEVGRYLRQAAFERRSWQWLKDKRKYSYNAYQYYLNNMEIREVEIDGTMQKVPYVNFSKHAIFLMNCRLRNVEVLYHKVGKRQLVYLFENQTDKRTEAHYATAEIEHDDLFDDNLTTAEYIEDYDTINGDYDE